MQQELPEREVLIMWRRILIAVHMPQCVQAQHGRRLGQQIFIKHTVIKIRVRISPNLHI